MNKITKILMYAVCGLFAPFILPFALIGFFTCKIFKIELKERRRK